MDHAGLVAAIIIEVPGGAARGQVPEVAAIPDTAAQVARALPVAAAVAVADEQIAAAAVVAAAAVLGVEPRALRRAARGRRARALNKSAVLGRVAGHAPPQILVEGRGAVEHAAQVRDPVDRPGAEVLVESRAPGEHVAHVRDARRVPRADVVVKRLGGRAAGAEALVRGAKQVRHVRHGPGLPRRDVAVRRHGGGAVREPEVDGRPDGGVVHGLAEAAAARVRRGGRDGEAQDLRFHTAPRPPGLLCIFEPEPGARGPSVGGPRPPPRALLAGAGSPPARAPGWPRGNLAQGARRGARGAGAQTALYRPLRYRRARRIKSKWCGVAKGGG